MFTVFFFIIIQIYKFAYITKILKYLVFIIDSVIFMASYLFKVVIPQMSVNR